MCLVWKSKAILKSLFQGFDFNSSKRIVSWFTPCVSFMKRVFNQVNSTSQKPKLEPPSLTLQTEELSTLGMHAHLHIVGLHIVNGMYKLVRVW